MNDLKLITKIELWGDNRYCTLHFERGNGSIIGVRLDYNEVKFAIEKANLLEYILNYGCHGLIAEFNGDTLKKISAVPNMSDRLNK